MASPQNVSCFEEKYGANAVSATAFRPAVRGRRRVEIEPVVAPAALAGERRDRHQLDCGHAELAQAVQAWDHTVERPFVGERADVQLVEDELVERDALPTLVGPLERARVDDL